MKIIGHSGSNGVLCEMTRDEVAKVMGHTYENNLPYPDYSRRDKLPVGMEVKVSDVYLRLMAQQQAADQLNLAAKTLDSLAGLCRVTIPQIESLGGGQ